MITTALSAQREVREVWLVTLLEWDSQIVVAVYDNEISAREHAASGPSFEVKPMVVESRFDKAGKKLS